MRTTDGQTPAKVAEQLRDDEIHVWRLGYRHAWGRAPFRALLGAYLGRPAEAVALVEGAHGRPVLAEAGQPWAFNWSHSGDQAVLAIARGVEPGIDLERLRARPRALDATRRDAAFLELWTAKEAVLKAIGRGLAFGLQRLCLAVPPLPPALLWLDGDDAAQWQLRHVAVDAAHVAMLAWRGAPRRVRAWTLAATA